MPGHRPRLARGFVFLGLRWLRLARRISRLGCATFPLFLVSVNDSGMQSFACILLAFGDVFARPARIIALPKIKALVPKRDRRPAKYWRRAKREQIGGRIARSIVEVASASVRACEDFFGAAARR
jgi:hypothetical protein